MRVEFHPFADRELSEAAEFYENQTPGLGADFVAEVERVLDLLRRIPMSGIPHRRHSERFPRADSRTA